MIEHIITFAQIFTACVAAGLVERWLNKRLDRRRRRK